MTPFEGAGCYTPEGEAKRQALNNWIRTSKAYDGVIDFDHITRDPAAPAKFLPAYDSGDHLHPGDAGYEAMGDSVDLALFGNSCPVPVIRHIIRGRGIPAGCVAPPSNMATILRRRALPAGRRAPRLMQRITGTGH